MKKAFPGSRTPPWIPGKKMSQFQGGNDDTHERAPFDPQKRFFPGFCQA